ncbi:MAG: DNA gyrase subunit A [Chloroflexi bacterium]|nr:DNA gyrase subunit A [Chloroflexota bacterium]MDA1004382.1 DNA gyrase subunit A [Chloroflexota bacterium]
MVQDTPEIVGLVRIEDEMRVSYLDYAMSVIVSRALPDARDGLKPVQRRILFGMQELGVGPNSAFKKTARTVGEVMGKFHPHGDSAIYDALVRMAQDFSMRYPLITGQGNFGSVDGDPPAQMRYTEARLAPIAAELLGDIDRNTVDFQPNFDDSINEPIVLPARLPNLLLNGGSGIAVGMATNIPPHNLNEICDAIVTVIEQPESTVDDLMEIVKGPDFPTAGFIFNRAEIRQAYATGRGKIMMRARMELEESKAGRHQIIVTELPYQTNKSTLLERIAEMVRSKRLEGISDLRDESDRHGMRVVIELGRGATYQSVRNQLYKHTALQSTFAYNMLALLEGQPKTLSLKDAIEAFIAHRREVIRRRSEFDLEKARERAHILEGLLKALENLDAIIQAIRASESADAAKTALQATPFELSERQAQAVLDMQLRRLAALERQKIESEHAELMVLIGFLEDLLAHPTKIDDVIKTDCAELKEKFGDARRTQVVAQAVENISEEDLVAHQQVVVTISERGYMKRVPLDTYRLQRRGGRGVTGMTTREEDAVRHMIVCDTHDSLLLFTRQGKVYSLKGFEVPEGSRTARGIPVANLVEVTPEDRITAVVVVQDFNRDSMVFFTERGEVKRTPLNQFESVRRAGLIAMNLESGDSLVDVRAASDRDDAIIVTSDGQAIRFSVGSLRVASRASGGVRGVRPRAGATVIAGVIDADGEDLLVITELGQGKRTSLAEYPTKGRGGNGMVTFRVSRRSGPLAVARAVRPEQELIVVSTEGIVMRCRADTISRQGRSTQGVQVMNVGEHDRVSASAVIDLSNAPGAAPASPDGDDDDEFDDGPEDAAPDGGDAVDGADTDEAVGAADAEADGAASGRGNGAPAAAPRARSANGSSARSRGGKRPKK